MALDSTGVVTWSMVAPTPAISSSCMSWQAVDSWLVLLVRKEGLLVEKASLANIMAFCAQACYGPVEVSPIPLGSSTFIFF